MCIRSNELYFIPNVAYKLLFFINIQVHGSQEVAEGVLGPESD